MSGGKLGTSMTLATACCALAALAVGLGHDRGTISRLGSSAFWVGDAAFLAIALVLAQSIRPGSTGRNAWGLVTLATLWLPSQLPSLVALGLALGLTFDESNAQALVNGIGGLAVAGLATGFGARLRPWPRAQAVQAMVRPASAP
jgi:hypothetical protein